MLRESCAKSQLSALLPDKSNVALPVLKQRLKSSSSSCSSSSAAHLELKAAQVDLELHTWLQNPRDPQAYSALVTVTNDFLEASIDNTSDTPLEFFDVSRASATDIACIFVKVQAILIGQFPNEVFL